MDLGTRLKTDRYFDEDGNMVFTEKFLLRQGRCCGLRCRHCPYEPRHQAGSAKCRDDVAAAKAASE
jgi:hypothetical protein